MATEKYRFYPNYKVFKNVSLCCQAVWKCKTSEKNFKKPQKSKRLILLFPLPTIENARIISQ